ncbi:hypothetical protein RCL1_006652 [Eukaryota sp. TZLM3-RCL]
MLSNLPGRLHKHNGPQALCWSSPNLLAWASGSLINVSDSHSLVTSVPASAVVTCLSLTSSVVSHPTDDSMILLAFSDANGTIVIWDLLEHKYTGFLCYSDILTCLNLPSDPNPSSPPVASLSWIHHDSERRASFLIVSLSSHPFVLVLDVTCRILTSSSFPFPIISHFTHQLLPGFIVSIHSSEKDQSVLIVSKLSMIPSICLLYDSESMNVLTSSKFVSFSPCSLVYGEFMLIYSSFVSFFSIKNVYENSPPFLSSVIKKSNLTGPLLKSMIVKPPQLGLFSDFLIGISNRDVVVIYQSSRDQSNLIEYKAVAAIDVLKPLNRKLKGKSQSIAISSVAVYPFTGLPLTIVDTLPSLLLSILTSDGRLSLWRVSPSSSSSNSLYNSTSSFLPLSPLSSSVSVFSRDSSIENDEGQSISEFDNDSVTLSPPPSPPQTPLIPPPTPPAKKFTMAKSSPSAFSISTVSIIFPGLPLTSCLACCCASNYSSQKFTLAAVGTVDGSIFLWNLNQMSLICRYQLFSNSQVRQIELTDYGLIASSWSFVEKEGVFKNYLSFISFINPENLTEIFAQNFKLEESNANMRQFHTGNNGRLIVVLYRSSTVEVYDLFPRQNQSNRLPINSNLTSCLSLKLQSKTIKISHNFGPIKLSIPPLPAQPTAATFDINQGSQLRFMIATADGTINCFNVNIDLSRPDSEFVIGKPVKITLNQSDLISCLFWNLKDLIVGDTGGNFHLLNLKTKDLSTIPGGKKSTVVKGIRAHGDLESNQFVVIATFVDGSAVVITPEILKMTSLGQKSTSPSPKVNGIPQKVAKLPRSVDVRLISINHELYSVLLSQDGSLRFSSKLLEPIYPSTNQMSVFLSNSVLNTVQSVCLKYGLPLILTGDFDREAITISNHDSSFPFPVTSFFPCPLTKISFNNLNFSVLIPNFKSNISFSSACYITHLLTGDYWSLFAQLNFIQNIERMIEGGEKDELVSQFSGPERFNNLIVNQILNHLKSNSEPNEEIISKSIIIDRSDLALELCSKSKAIPLILTLYSFLSNSINQNDTSLVLKSLVDKLINSGDKKLAILLLISLSKTSEAINLLIQDGQYHEALLVAHNQGSNIDILRHFCNNYSKFWGIKFPIKSVLSHLISRDYFLVLSELTYTGMFQLAEIFIEILIVNNVEITEKGKFYIENLYLMTGSLFHQLGITSSAQKYWEKAGKEGQEVLKQTMEKKNNDFKNENHNN